MAGKGCDLAFSDVIGELGNDVRTDVGPETRWRR